MQMLMYLIQISLVGSKHTKKRGKKKERKKKTKTEKTLKHLLSTSFHVLLCGHSFAYLNCVSLHFENSPTLKTVKYAV